MYFTQYVEQKNSHKGKNENCMKYFHLRLYFYVFQAGHDRPDFQNGFPSLASLSSR